MVTPDPSSAGLIAQVEAEFARACDSLAPLRRNARLLLGISAGGDSMVLLELAARLAPARDWTLAAAHLDHATRPESANEADFVAARCAALGVPLVRERLDPATLAPPGAEPTQAGAEPTEETMRRARHEFFARALAQSGAETLALAHQLDDRAETFLMRLLAGSGPTGLASIRAEQQIGDIHIVRPLLRLRRAELRDYLRARGLTWRDDPGNEDTRRKRAWIRNEILPRLDAWMGLEVAPRVGAAAELIQEEADALTQACDLMLRQLEGPILPQTLGAAPAGGPQPLARLNLSDPLWRNAAPPLRRRLLRQWLWRLSNREHPPGREAIEEALRFIEKAAPGSRLRTIRRIQLTKINGWLVATPEERD